MSGTPPTTGAWVWPNRLLSADDLRRHWTGQRELVLLPKTVVTPLAADELRAKGVRITWRAALLADAAPVKAGTWIYAQEKTDAIVIAALQAFKREGIELNAIEFTTARRFAEAILTGPRGGVLFCGDPATACCIANKVAGVRAASVGSVAQVTRVKQNLAANLYAVDVPGRTLFEIRQVVKAIVAGSTECPEAIAKLLKELDGYAHR